MRPAPSIPAELGVEFQVEGVGQVGGLAAGTVAEQGDVPGERVGAAFAVGGARGEVEGPEVDFVVGVEPDADGAGHGVETRAPHGEGGVAAGGGQLVEGLELALDGGVVFGGDEAAGALGAGGARGGG